MLLYIAIVILGRTNGIFFFFFNTATNHNLLQFLTQHCYKIYNKGYCVKKLMPIYTPSRYSTSSSFFLVNATPVFLYCVQQQQSMCVCIYECMSCLLLPETRWWNGENEPKTVTLHLLLVITRDLIKKKNPVLVILTETGSMPSKAKASLVIWGNSLSDALKDV